MLRKLARFGFPDDRRNYESLKTILRLVNQALYMVVHFLSVTLQNCLIFSTIYNVNIARNFVRNAICIKRIEICIDCLPASLRAGSTLFVNQYVYRFP